MQLIDNSLYLEDIKYIADLPLPWEKLEGKTILVSGGSGLIGSCLIDTLMWKNKKNSLNCRIYSIGRDLEKAKRRFEYCWDEKFFSFIRQDIQQEINTDRIGDISYVLHLASNTHPVAYSTDPIGTIMTNILGTGNMLQIAVKHHVERFVFASSNEIYGENRGDVELFDESYCGYIDCNTLRAGYPESKRCGEALCQAYRRKYGIDVVIPRFSRVYGPTVLMNDTKASSQFLLNAVSGKEIVLKSDGSQYYSYTYITDAVSGLLTVLLKGEDGEAYNIADERSDINLREFAQLAAKAAGTEITFEIPDTIEEAGYSKATRSRLDAAKLKTLGWEAKIDIRTGVVKTVDILRRIEDT